MSLSRKLAILPLISLLAPACWGRNIEYAGGTADTGTDEPPPPPPPGACEDEDLLPQGGYRLSGRATYFDSGEPVPQSMCVWAIDPAPALVGQDPVTLANGLFCDDDGNWLIPAMTENPAIGAFVMIDDCEGDPDTVMLSGTGISGDDISPLGEGDELTNLKGNVVTLELAAAFTAEADGYDGDLIEGGFLAGFTLDSGDSPVDGAEVICGACTNSTNYGDADPSDGWFGAGGSPNSSSSAAGGGFFLIPEGSVGVYEVDDGGSHSWTPGTYGSLPGYAVFVNLVAN